MTLKFENTAKVGDTIKAYDFKPMPDSDEYYVIGKVVKKHYVEESSLIPYNCYVIKCTEDPTRSDEYSRVGEEVLVPFEVSVLDYDTRIKLVEEV